MSFHTKRNHLPTYRTGNVTASRWTPPHPDVLLRLVDFRNFVGLVALLVHTVVQQVFQLLAGDVLCHIHTEIVDLAETAFENQVDHGGVITIGNQVGQHLGYPMPHPVLVEHAVVEDAGLLKLTRQNAEVDEAEL